MTVQKQTSPQIELEEIKRANNAFNISVITSLMFGLLVAISVFINRSFATDIISLSALAVGAVVAATSAVLSRRGKSDLGILLLIAALIAIVASRVFVQKGLAIPTGIVHIILVSSIAIYTLPPKWVSRVIMLAFINTAVTIVVDQFTTGVPTSPQPQIAIIISSVLGLIYLAILARQFPSLPLRAKLIIGLLLLTILPLIVLGWQSNGKIRSVLEGQIKADILRSSLSASAFFQISVNQLLGTVQDLSHLSEVIDYVSLPENQRAGSEMELAVINKLTEVGRSDPPYIKSYALVDETGKVIFDTDSANINTLFGDPDFLNFVIAHRKTFVSGMTLTTDPAQQNFYVASPVYSKSNELAGVLIMTCDAKIIEQLVNEWLRQGQAPANEYTFIIDSENYFVIGHSMRADLYKSYLSRDDPRVSNLIKRGLLSQSSLDLVVIPQPEIIAKLTNMADTASFRVPSREFNGQLVEIAASRVENANWIVVTGQPVSTIETITQNQLRTTVIITIIIAALAALIAILISNLFTRPLLQLTKVAENISTGDFTQRADVLTKDEIGTLANAFNTMSSQIQELVTGLEKRVEQRTSELEYTSKQSEKRAQDLQTITVVAHYISTENDLGQLLPLVTRIVSERFGFYHVGIFLLDETGKFAVLRASNSPGGQEMLQRQHRLEVGQTGIVGNETPTGLPRIAWNPGPTPIYFNNPNLPDTRLKMALPLIARSATIGALDVQSTVPNAFTDADVSIISLLADQIAIAIDNARLIEESQSALAESKAIFNEYLSEAWQGKTSSEVLGYHQSSSGGKVITSSSLSELNSEHANGHKTLEIPIRVRGQVIGALNIRSIISEGDWSEDDVNVVEAVAERLGLALDNARLFEETSTRASRERLVTEITTKIRGTNNPQEMIKTAVEELQRALGATRVEIVPQKAAPPPDK